MGAEAVPIGLLKFLFTTKPGIVVTGLALIGGSIALDASRGPNLPIQTDKPAQAAPASGEPTSKNKVGDEEQMGTGVSQGKSGNEVMKSGGKTDATIVGWNNKAYARCGIPDFSAKPGAGEECNFYCLHNFLKLPNEKGGVIVRLIKSGKTSCEPGRINKGGYDDSQRNSSFDGPGLPRGVLRRQYTSG